MLKRIGFILMLASGMTIGASECTFDDIDKDGWWFWTNWEIPKHCQLLNLSKNRLGAEGAQLLATALKENDTLLWLNLYTSYIGDEGAKALATALKENKNIKVYTFNFDQLEIDELEPIAKKFNILVPSLITHPRDIWGIQTPPAVPATFFINPDGELSLSLFRPQTKDDLNKIIIDLILEYQTRNHT